MAARSKEFRDKYNDQVHKLVEKLRGPDRDKLASLMNDATIAEAHLGSTAADANDHLTKPEQQLKADRAAGAVQRSLARRQALPTTRCGITTARPTTRSARRSCRG
jgi:hypothetical protein